MYFVLFFHILIIVLNFLSCTERTKRRNCEDWEEAIQMKGNSVKGNIKGDGQMRQQMKKKSQKGKFCRN